MDSSVTPVRRLGASAAMVATAGGLAAIAVHDTHWIEWGLLAFSGAVGLAGVGLARRSMTAQVLSRGMAWTVLAPSVLVTVFSALSGHTEWTAAALTAGSGGALLLARPMLHTAEARAEFAPSSFRRWLLAGATAAAGAGIVSGVFGLDSLRHLWSAIPLIALSLSLLASAVGVVRMRAWGILLGALTSVITFVTALFFHDAAGLALALSAIPGAMLILPVLIAKRQRAQAEAASSRARVSSHVSFDGAPADHTLRVRVGTSVDASFDDEFESSEERAAAPAPAARAQA